MQAYLQKEFAELAKQEVALLDRGAGREQSGSGFRAVSRFRLNQIEKEQGKSNRDCHLKFRVLV